MEIVMTEGWTLDSWRKKPVAQLPTYPHVDGLTQVERQLATFPPLVFAGEARSLKRALARVAAGDAFLLQGGDCRSPNRRRGTRHHANPERTLCERARRLTDSSVWAAAGPGAGQPELAYGQGCRMRAFLRLSGSCIRPPSGEPGRRLRSVLRWRGDCHD